MVQRRLKARYQVKGPKREIVTYKKCYMDDTKSLQMEDVKEEMDTFMVYFPQGHSIRVTSFERLKELGYHVKPRLVDMDTGDVVDVGGDFYDFSQPEEDVVLIDDDETSDIGGAKSSRKRESNSE